MNTSLSPQERFQLKLEAKDNGCIECQGAEGKGGYIYFWYSGQNRYAHRMAWFFEHGDIPEDKIVLHTCDNPRCVNLKHLKLGTHQDNTNDMIDKGRKFIALGTGNGAAKIAEETALAIKKDLIAGIRQCDIVRKYQVTRAIVRHIDLGRAWRWLDGTNDRQL